MSRRPLQIAFDAIDTRALAGFWAAALADRGYRIPDPPEGFGDWPAYLAAEGVPEQDWYAGLALEEPTGRQPRLFFQHVPEPKTAKNRVHLDLLAGGGAGVPLDEQRKRVSAEVERLVGLGAARVAEHTELGVYWVVMLDPEGNEFCA